MRLLIAVTLLLLAPVLPSFAQDADQTQRLEAAHELVQLTTADAVMTPMVDAIWPNLEMTITGGKPGADPAVMSALKEAFTAELLKTMDSVVDDYAKLYSENFTLDELNVIVGFYQSEAGKKLVAAQPKIMNEMLPTLTAKLQVSLPIAMQAVMDQAKQKGIKSP